MTTKTFNLYQGNHKLVEDLLYDVEEKYDFGTEFFKFTVDPSIYDMNKKLGEITFFTTSNVRATPNSGTVLISSNNLVVDWGDGVIEHINYNDGEFDNNNGDRFCTHVYADPYKTYQITIGPKNKNEKGWGKGINFYGDVYSVTPLRIISVDSPITKNMWFNEIRNVGLGGRMFYGCENLTMGPEFNLPQDEDITEVGDGFCCEMFERCLNLTMNDIFNLPQNIENIGTCFCSNMFLSCLKLKMNDIFNLPQNITTLREGFCSNMFYDDYFYNDESNILDTNDVFQLPQKIKEISYSSFIGGDVNFSSILLGTFGMRKFKKPFVKQFFGDLVIPDQYLRIKSSSGKPIYYATFGRCQIEDEEISPDTIPQLKVTPRENLGTFISCTPDDVIEYCPREWGGYGRTKS